MAAGKAERWNNHLDIPKQLAPVGGEPVIHRLFRLLKERKKKFVVTVPEIGYLGEVPCKEYVGSSYPEIDKFLNGSKLFKEHVLFLYGDVYWSAQALDTVLEDKSENMFFGRSEKSEVFHYDAGKEIFAVKFTRGVFDKLNEFKARYLDKEFEESGTWILYEWLGRKEFTEINDLTEDFDSPQNYGAFLQSYNRIKDLLK